DHIFRQLTPHYHSKSYHLTAPDLMKQDEAIAMEEVKIPLYPPTNNPQQYVVTWDGPNDPANPQNWSYFTKTRITIQLGFTTMASTLASSIFSSTFQVLSVDYDIPVEVTILGISLFILGYAVGPLCWAPLSELMGRRISIFAPFFVFALMSIGTATAHDPAGIFLTRFFAGCFASAPVSNVGGALSDMWNQKQRGTAILMYSCAVVGGPCVGPLLGAAITNSYLGWTEWIVVIYAFFMFAMGVLFIPETFAPVILRKKAQTLRIETQCWQVHSKAEEISPTPRDLFTKYFARPILLLIFEPIVTCFCIYISFVYATLYLFFEAYPIVFREIRGWEPVPASLPFLAILVGIIVAVIGQKLYQPVYERAVDANGGRAEPEARMPPMMLASILYPVGIFWFAWTSTPEYHWILPVLASAVIGAGFIVIFQQSMSYLIDTYLQFAASVTASQTFLRSLLAAGFPLFALPMYHNLGVNWASSLIGFLATLMMPFPFVMYFFGARIRKWSKERKSKIPT
ncbi:hypothetical protein PROFUN_11503, partial [Planoprotostelium fungivorum]